MCYQLPENQSRIGRQFSCDHTRILHQLGLIDQDDNYVDLSRVDAIPIDPIMITAVSDSHWLEMRQLISRIRAFRPDQLLIVYDIGLSESNARHLQSLCNVRYRKFEFDNYPSYVRKLTEFRWKPIVIAVSVGALVATI